MADSCACRRHDEFSRDVVPAHPRPLARRAGLANGRVLVTPRPFDLEEAKRPFRLIGRPMKNGPDWCLRRDARGRGRRMSRAAEDTAA